MGRGVAPVLVIHGGAGMRAPAPERPARRRAMVEAVSRGRAVLEGGGSALDAVCETIVAMENNPLFNAGYGSALNAEGDVEMDASVMVVPLAASSGADGASGQVIGAGAVAGVRRVRNPVLAARAVMTQTPHVLIIGAPAERLAVRAGVSLCRPEELITERARARWQTYMGRAAEHGTVGAAALDLRGQLAAATSTGGITGKMAGRVGDSAIVGAGTFADRVGAASATGVGEAIMKTTLCREVVRMLARTTPARAAAMAIKTLGLTTGGEAGVIVVDKRGRIGYAHNAQAMDVAMFTAGEGIRHYAG
ncbi:MAG TPA: isoaspartyl peptidase/L-asparaginase [Candidatus Binataceae bacterium]